LATYLVSYSGTPVVVTVSARQVSTGYPVAAVIIVVAVRCRAIISLYLRQIIIIIAVIVIIYLRVIIVINRLIINLNRRRSRYINLANRDMKT
jgi:hypothetical protein